MRLFLLLGVAAAMQCAELQSVYQSASCCTSEGQTCLRSVPSCADSQKGEVCFNGESLEVKGLSEYLEFGEALILKKHLIPSENAQFDLGNAENKIRHLFLSDN
jgi:hypothetical protein